MSLPIFKNPKDMALKASKKEKKSMYESELVQTSVKVVMFLKKTRKQTTKEVFEGRL